jgi:hypothetical protein
MSNRKAKGTQTDTINRYSPQVQESFDLVRLDAFVTSLGVDFVHFKAMPSPIGKKDRGDYRKSDGVDTITSNGMIYKAAGIFTATMTDNDRKNKRSEGGALDPSQSRLVLPRFYNKTGSDDTANGERIYLMPGDRIYVADPAADVEVATAQEMDYEPGIDNEALFPIILIEGKILDSRNIEYTENLDFIITKQGRIRWLDTGSNPGIDPDTGKGRVYSIRYHYNAYWYIVALPKEIRVTNVTTGGVRSPERMPYHALVVREFIFHNQNRGDKDNQLKPANPARVEAAPKESINPNKFNIPVDMSTISEDDE